MRAAKIEALLRALPKAWRRHFVPVPDFARALHERLAPDGRSLTAAMATELARMTGTEPPADVWDETALEARHRMRFAIVDADGAVVDAGRDPSALAARHGDAGQADLDTGSSAYEATGLTDWPGGDLPERVELERHGITIEVVPALYADGERAGLTVFSRERDAVRAHRAGVRRLIRQRLSALIRDLLRGLDGLERVALHFGAAIDGRPWRDDFVDAVVDRAFLGSAAAPRSADAFDAVIAAGRGELWGVAEALLAELDAIGKRQRAVRRRLEGNLPMTWIEPARDLADQLAHLVYPGFITATPPDRLAEYARYLDAMSRRLDVLDREPERDRAARSQIEPLWARVRERLPPLAELAWADAELQHVRWLVEELRVSLFAQHLGTRVSISPAKLDKRLDELGGRLGPA
jgi:ATP-dependent helicase HrpA